MSEEERLFRCAVADKVAAAADRDALAAMVESAHADRIAMGRNADALRAERNAAEERLRQLVPILQEAHDELVKLGSHRTMLVAALIGHVREMSK